MVGYKSTKKKDRFVNSTFSGYHLDSKISAGNFGVVYTATHQVHGQVAVKIEVPDVGRLSNTKRSNLLLHKEYDFYQNHLGGLSCVPKLVSYFTSSDKNFLVMELFDIDLRHSFEDTFKHSFTTGCITRLFYEMTCIMELIHSRNIVYRDVKPDNFLLKFSHNFTRLVITDFGLSSFYRVPNIDGVLTHISLREHQLIVGTPRYISIHTHKMTEQSRRDDLESLGFVIGYFTRPGGLPWQGLPVKEGEDKNELIKNEKLAKFRTLFSNQNWQEYLNYVHQLEFADAPDYEFLKEKALSGSSVDELSYDWEQDRNAGTSSAQQQPSSSTAAGTAINFRAKPKNKTIGKRILSIFKKNSQQHNNK